MAAPLAAVTGGTGFLGRHLVGALAAAGWRVRLLARRPPADPFGPGLHPEIVPGDLDDLGALRRLCKGAQAVIHAAGLVKAKRVADFRAVNADGAGRVAATAREAAPGARFVLVSSLAARAPDLSPYARSKRGGEEAVRGVLDEAWVVRLPAVYGPGDRATLPLFRAAALSPILPVLRPDAQLALIHAQDAARGLAALASAPGGGRTLSICDGRPDGYALAEIMREAGAAVGRAPRLVRVPDAALRAAGWLGALAGALGAPSMLTSGKVRELLHRDWSLAPDEWTELGNAAPTYRLADGLRQTVEWYRAAGWLAGTR